MDKISIKLTRKEWTGLAALVLAESSKFKEMTHPDDRYYKALFEALLREVYIKLHNKLHSLREAKNSLNLTISEGAAFNWIFADEDYHASNPFAMAIITSITSQIDQKLA